MERVQWALQNLMLFERNREWWDSDLHLRHKLGYYFQIPAAYAYLLFAKAKHVRYLGHEFVFDNIATPLNLQAYPREVSHLILGNVEPGFSVERVLDIGGNIGQFSVTLKHFLPSATIDVFEPNTMILPMLKSNTAHFGDDIRIFPYALSSKKQSKMFYEPGRSGIGSFLEENAGNSDRVESTNIESTNDVAQTTGNAMYDLVKVDVEGYEFDALNCLKGIKTRYLFVEVSSQSRSKKYKHSAFYQRIRECFGDFDIVYQGDSHRGKPTFDILCEIS